MLPTKNDSTMDMSILKSRCRSTSCLFHSTVNTLLKYSCPISIVKQVFSLWTLKQRGQLTYVNQVNRGEVMNKIVQCTYVNQDNRAKFRNHNARRGKLTIETTHDPSITSDCVLDQLIPLALPSQDDVRSAEKSEKSERPDDTVRLFALVLSCSCARATLDACETTRKHVA